ncbi:MAG: alcohol dehydrogenase catalytic domain-containing protein [Anaerolineae bacterium]|nr:alcohol dehydrogenase catalytic domain-containing protein [Anaerolineae bacterium]
MKGIFVTAKGQTDILELPEPEIGPYEALVQVEACGICNSTDVKIIHGEFVSGTYPVLLGHESVGRVIRIGNRVTSFQVGDRVLRSILRDEHILYPGGRSRWGGFVEQAIVVDVWAEKGAAYMAFPHPQQVVPAHIPPAQAAAMITLKETLSCLESSDVQTGQSLAIVGTGPVAQTLLLAASLSGIRPVVVFGRRSRWADRFADLGADGYVAGEDVPPEVQAILDRGGFDRVVEAVGSRAALDRCLQIVGPAGRVNVYGVAPESDAYLPQQMADPRVFRGKVAEAETHDKLLQWIERGEVNLADWVSHTLFWTGYRRGFEMVEARTANKIILTFEQGG